MTINGEITIAEIVTVLFSIIGGAFALRQYIKNSIIKRASYYNDAYNKLRDDKEIVQILNMIDYGETEWYPFELCNDSEIERKVDKTFGYIDYLCYLRSRRLISKKEFMNLEYDVIRIGNDSSALDYLHNLYLFSKENKTAMSFSNLLEYLKHKKMIDKDFYERDSEKYTHYLNY